MNARKPLTPGTLVKLKNTCSFGVVRSVEEDGTFLVEPDHPDVDEDGWFMPWKCRRDQLLVKTPQGWRSA